ncbi:MAG: polyprenyl synthetase family protein [Phycisphaera sp.]|nr:polyprenyl synthetase family protein [Phycisphaera sp.]
MFLTACSHDTYRFIMTTPSATQDKPAIDVAQLTAPAGAVEAYMDKVLTDRPLPANLREAAKYALLGGGKRLRPVLIVRSCEAVGGTLEDALPPACAMEMIHCFSLVHDDLPAMDDDDLRRGRPTLHRHTNEAMAILAGDLLTGLAFEVLATRIADPVLANRCVTELALATNDMIAGQVYDTLPDFPPEVRPIEKLRTIHRNKTGALIRASCRLGAILAGCDEKQLAQLTRYGEAVGLMFQVVDDLLDVTQTTEHLGKKAGKDSDAGKLTYPGLIGIDASKREVERLRNESLDALTSLGQAAQPLRDLCEYLAVRTK